MYRSSMPDLRLPIADHRAKEVGGSGGSPSVFSASIVLWLDIACGSGSLFVRPNPESAVNLVDLALIFIDLAANFVDLALFFFDVALNFLIWR